MQISSINSIGFGARFIHSEDLKNIAQYAIENGKAAELNQARKNIDSIYLKTRIGVRVFEIVGGYPGVEFTRYVPKSVVSFPTYESDYATSKITYYTAEKMDILQFALDKIIKMGTDIPNNKIFKRVVVYGK